VSALVQTFQEAKLQEKRVRRHGEYIEQLQPRLEALRGQDYDVSGLEAALRALTAEVETQLKARSGVLRFIFVRSRKRELDEAMEFVKEQVGLLHLDQGINIVDIVDSGEEESETNHVVEEIRKAKAQGLISDSLADRVLEIFEEADSDEIDAALESTTAGANDPVRGPLMQLSMVLSESIEGEELLGDIPAGDLTIDEGQKVFTTKAADLAIYRKPLNSDFAQPVPNFFQFSTSSRLHAKLRGSTGSKK